ncbi:MAG: ABC transporter permease [Sedimentisphaerales bacterium]|nr:ABC transporter permease [Sedimentisphaerales bacterium]
MITILKDIKYAIRQLRKNPGFTIVAVVSLALGIGVNTAIFSLLNAVWMRSLPVPNPHQLRVVNWSGQNWSLSHWSGSTRNGDNGAVLSGSFPYPLYRDFKENLDECSDVFAFYSLPGMTVIGSKNAVTADVMMVSGDFFDGYGVDALIGRTLSPGDESSQAGPVAVITYRLWEKEYNLNHEVLGQIITINQQSFTIVGVLPESYCSPEVGDFASIYVPMSAQPVLSPSYRIDARDHWWANIMVRLEPGADESKIRTAMEALFLQILSAPGQGTRMDNPHIVLEDGSRGLLPIRKQMAQGLFLLMAAVGLVLLIACANLAGLLLARGAARRQELTVRAAMGAGRGRLVRQLLTESLVLSFAGAGMGLLLAIWIKALVLGFIPDTLDKFHIDVRIDLNVLLFTIGAAVVTSLLFGLLPALRITRIDLCSGLKGQRALGVPGQRLGKLLVAAQVSLAVLLIVGTGLLIQTLINLYRVDLGFRTDKILIFGVNPSQAGYRDANSVRFYDHLEDKIAGLPGVGSVALSGNSLLGGTVSGISFSVPGRSSENSKNVYANTLDVSEAFFQTMDIPLLSGRRFEKTDTQSRPGVVIINEALMQTCFPKEDPLNQSISVSGRNYQIVGVCGDAKYDRVQKKIEPTLYFSHRQANPGAMYFEIRTAGDPLALVPAVRKIVFELDRTIPLEQVSTQLQLFKTSIIPERLFTYLGSGLALLGILLSCIGLYGLLAFMVTRRTVEIGVRMALGARPKDVAWPVIRSALWLAGFGLVVGVPISLVFTRLLRSVLFGVNNNDPMTIILSIFLVVLVAALAAWIPARRAAKIDPMEALRYE